LEQKYKPIFIINESKDEIGGDFYWVENLGSRLFTICGDCTGHGIPGAMLSMISYQIIEEVVKCKGIHDPGTILTKIHEKYVQIFDPESHLKNYGMDISICVFDFEEKKLEYASAKSLILLRQDNQVLRLKGDCVSIGDQSQPNFKFTTYGIQLIDAAWVFQFTDGIIDQFGGE